MMKNKFEYLGYKADIEFSHDDQTFYGVVKDVDALIMFAGDSVEELSREFVVAVDGYLESCRLENISPTKPYSGTFNVRVGGDIHRAAQQCAKKLGISLNEFVKRSLEISVNTNKFVKDSAGQSSHYLRHPAIAPTSVAEWADFSGREGEVGWFEGAMPASVAAPKPRKEWN